MNEQRGPDRGSRISERQAQVAGRISRRPRQVQEGEGSGGPHLAAPSSGPTGPPLPRPCWVRTRALALHARASCLSVSACRSQSPLPPPPPAPRRQPLAPHHLPHLGSDPQLAQQPQPPRPPRGLRGPKHKKIRRRALCQASTMPKMVAICSRKRPHTSTRGPTRGRSRLRGHTSRGAAGRCPQTPGSAAREAGPHRPGQDRVLVHLQGVCHGGP